jgi:hypothetical protein
MGTDECAQLSNSSHAPATAACPVPWETVSLLADGNLHVCCNSYRRLGHVRQASVGEAWRTGSAYAGLRSELLHRTLHQDCRTCLGENFVLPGEVTPVIYLKGCSPDTGHGAALAHQIGRRIEHPANVAPHLRAGIDSLDWRATGRITGWIETRDGRDLGQPLTLALAVDRVVRSVTNTVNVSPTLAQWSAAIDLPHPGATLEIFAFDGATTVRIHVQPSSPAPAPGPPDGPVHGFIDEVRRTDRFVHFIGWARDRSAATPAAGVAIYVAGKRVGSIRPWLPRPDVARAFGDTAANFGYSLDLPLAVLTRATSRSLIIVARDESGREAPLEWSESALAMIAVLTALPALAAPSRLSAFHRFRRRFKTIRAAAMHPVSADQAC